MKLPYVGSLRLRVVYSYLLFAIFLSTSFSLTLTHFLRSVEDDIVNRVLDTELNHLINLYDNYGILHLPASKAMSIYRIKRSARGDLPSYLQSVDAATRKVSGFGTEYRTAIRDVDDIRYILTIDASAFRAHEHFVIWTLILLSIGSSLAAIWIGHSLSSTIIEPVTRLAKAIERSKNDNGGTVKLEYFNTKDEVFYLAKTFIEYENEIKASLDREREFSGYVSHELTTPLTVVRANASLLISDSSLTDKHRQRAERMLRAASDISELVDIFLMVARQEDSAADEYCDPVEAINYVISNMLRASDKHRIRFIAEEGAAQSVPISRRGFLVILRNLVVNALLYTRGTVTIVLSEGEITIRDMGNNEKISPSLAGRRGLGLHIVDRICSNYGLEFTSDMDPGSGSRQTIRLPGTRSV